MQREIHRVAVTGVGIISSLGNSYAEVTRRLRAGMSGTATFRRSQELGLPSTVAGDIPDVSEKAASAGLKKKARARMSTSALYGVLAARDAIDAARLCEADLARSTTACIVGSSSGATAPVVEAAELTFSGRANRMGPYLLLRGMANNAVGSVALQFGIGGPSYSLASACATSGHAIGHAADMVRHGIVDLAIAGGADEIDDLIMSAFCALRIAVSSRYNDQPARASRPYDLNRDGFVMSGGAGIVVLEDLKRARSRGAHIYGEVKGYAATTDLFDFVHPDPQGRSASLCMQAALDAAGVTPLDIGYINTHGTGTVPGDSSEIAALRATFRDRLPPFSSTKSMGGHALGAAGAHEVIHCLSMLEGGYLAPSINIDTLDPEFEGAPIVRSTAESKVDVVLTNNFGFGGGNASLVLGRT